MGGRAGNALLALGAEKRRARLGRRSPALAGASESAFCAGGGEAEFDAVGFALVMECVSAAAQGWPVRGDELCFPGFARLMLLSAISKLENKQIQYLIFWHRYCTLGSKQKFHQEKTDKGVMDIVHNVKSGTEIMWAAHYTQALPSCTRHYS